ncbi:MAG TPA: M24 family metallopeptidase [Chitinophaga sp.]|uniref:M24 family metallopeptidase n=1 Tax=Chitinophaga sp. TaxID=1869181 RepID=UPI002C13F224|nr:M24 family metallopeptidase [Chitinophaga sp.]HVI48669.1 M24 family metallopeptidase [Chitinophaga sp.]
METTIKTSLIEAEEKALQLFRSIEEKGLLSAGKTEKELNTDIFNLAKELYGIEKYWHKRIVRSGPNTLFPYKENPPDLLIQEDDILFIDFGPIFEEWEADFGRTYVVGNDPLKHKLKNDLETAWYEAKAWFDQQTSLSGAALYQYTVDLAKKYGWTFGGEIAGHIIGQFPHEKLAPGTQDLYVHPENPNDMFAPDKNGQPREWILELHFIDAEKKIGGFFEQLLTR